MPSPVETTVNPRRALSKVQLESFTASPNPLLPFDQATLNWHVTLPDASLGEVRIILEGGGLKTPVKVHGSRSVSPTTTTTYKLTALSPPLSKSLGSVTVVVDTSACLTEEIPESALRADFNRLVDGIIADNPGLRRRRPDSIEVSSKGIELKLAFSVTVNNWANPDVNIEALIKLRVEDGLPDYTLAMYNFDIDFPWYVDVAHAAFLPAWLALALKEGHQESRVRSRLMEGIEAILEPKRAQLESLGYRLLRLTTTSDRISFTACPQG